MALKEQKDDEGATFYESRFIDNLEMSCLFIMRNLWESNCANSHLADEKIEAWGGLWNLFKKIHLVKGRNPSAGSFHLIFPLPGRTAPFHGSGSASESLSVHPCWSISLCARPTAHPLCTTLLVSFPSQHSSLWILFCMSVLSGELSVSLTRMPTP